MSVTWGVHLGLVSYERALELQRYLHAQVAGGNLDAEILLTLEHPPTVTLGKRATDRDLLLSSKALADRGVAVCRVGRGGKATYHGPGQLVMYPICRVGRSVRVHVSSLAEAGRRLLEELDVKAQWDERHPGLYVQGRKIGAVGVQVLDGVSLHGMALNISVDLSGFELIVPCGQPDASVTSVAREGGRVLPLRELGFRLMELFVHATGRGALQIFQSEHFLAGQIREPTGPLRS